MSKRVVTIFFTILILFVIAIPVAAITYGEPDDGEHPYVGFMIFFDPTYGETGGWFSCTGALLDSVTLLTAGHCTFEIGTDLQKTPGGRGGTDVWVTFDEVDVLAGFPSRIEIPDDAERNDARVKWLERNRSYIQGTAWSHPEYYHFVGFPNTRDVGVVILDHRVRMDQYVELAEAGVLDTLATKRGQQKQIFETAGYGTQEVVPFPQDEATRYKATSKIVDLRSALTDGYNLHTSNNPGKANGTGGSCFGDSGGPVMFNNTNVVVAVVSWGHNYNCKGADYSYRVDIAESRDFLENFVTVP